MTIAAEIEHGRRLGDQAEAVWNWCSAAGRLRAQRRADLIAAAADLRPGVHVLELGCGTGLFSTMFARHGCRLTAIDISPDLLARARLRRLPDAVVFQVDNAERLDQPDGAFDAVVGSSILHHLDLDRALAEIRRVLRPDGRLAFAEPNMLNPQVALTKNVGAIGRRLGECPGETAFFRWSLASRLKSMGLEQVEVRPFDFLHPATPAGLVSAVRYLGAWAETLPLLRDFAGSLLISARRT